MHSEIEGKLTLKWISTSKSLYTGLLYREACWPELTLIQCSNRGNCTILGWEVEKAMAPHSSTLAWKIPWTEEPGRLQSGGLLRVRHKWETSLSLFTFHFHALEKEMATHSSVLAWRIPGTEEPGGLPSMGSHRVGHDWSDLAAAAVCERQEYWRSFKNSAYQVALAI